MSNSRSKAIKASQTKQRDALWADAPDVAYKASPPFAQLPRILPLIVRILDSKEVSGTKAPGKTYVDLLCSDMGTGHISITNEAEHAFRNGYEKRPRTWREQIQILEEAGFIRKKDSGGAMEILLIDPIRAVCALRQRKKVDNVTWSALAKLQAKLGGGVIEDPLNSEATPITKSVQKNKAVAADQEPKESIS